MSAPQSLPSRRSGLGLEASGNKSAEWGKTDDGKQQTGFGWAGDQLAKDEAAGDTGLAYAGDAVMDYGTAIAKNIGFGAEDMGKGLLNAGENIAGKAENAIGGAVSSVGSWLSDTF